MTLLSRLFKNKSATDSVPKKVLANSAEQSALKLEQLPIDEIVSMATSEHEMRVAAIGKLPYGDALKELAFDTRQAAKIQVAARRRLAALIDCGDLDVSHLDNDIDDKAALLDVLSFCDRQQLQEQVLESVDDQQLLYQVALQGASAKLRRQAAARLTDREQIDALLKHSKGKDKAIYRIAKDKYDAFKEQDKHRQQLAASVDALCVALERHSKRAFDPMFNANFNHMKEQWSTLSQSSVDICTSQNERIEHAISACQAIMDEQVKIETQQQQHRQAVADAAKRRDNILQQLREIIAGLYGGDAINDERRQTIAQTVAELQQQWDVQQQYVKADDKQSTLYQRLLDAVIGLQQHECSLQQQLDTAIAAADTVDNSAVQQLRERLRCASVLHEDQLPDAVKASRQFIHQWDEKRKQEKETVQQLTRQIGGLIRRATDAIGRGQVRQAVGIRKSIEQKIANLNPVPTGVPEQLDRLDEKLQQLQDWRSFAVQPKMQELVRQMQVLVDTDLNPDVLAQKIKQLQEQWRTLSVGGGSQYQDLWEQFHQLAQTAYEPCKKHFNEQADIRQQNLQKRKDLVKQLADFFIDYNWDTADWKLVEKMLRVARREWRDYSPTERSAGKQVQADFDKQLADIQQHLDVEYEKNAQRKQRLIEQAKQLAESDDSRASIDKVKALQSNWKDIGVVARKVDQALWKEFRAHCDRVFDKRQQQSDQYKAELNDNLQQAQALCGQIEALSQLSGKELLTARDQLEQLRTAFHELGTLPKNNVNTVKSRFSAAVDQFETAMVKQRREAKEKVWTDMLNACATVNDYQLAVCDGGDSDPARNCAQVAIDAVAQWPKGGREAVEQKMAAISADKSQDYQANETALRLICIRMEIFAGKESPGSDQALRMNYQVERLQQGLGQANNNTDNLMTELMFDWVAAQPVPKEQYQSLLQRFNQARAQVAP